MTDLPTGYSGDASDATAARGKALVAYAVDQLVAFVRAVKADHTTIGVQKDFYRSMQQPENPGRAK